MMALSPKSGERLVMVGAGSGYYAAILAELVGPVGSVEAYEVETRLAGMAHRNLAPWPQVRVWAASGIEPPEADLIYVAASAASPPEAWLRALRPTGRLVMPWQPPGSSGVTLLVRRTHAGFAAQVLFRVSFIPCVGVSTDVEAQPGIDPTAVRSIRLRADGEPDDTAVSAHGEVWFSSSDPA